MIRQGKQLDNGMTMVLSGIAPGERVYPNPGPEITARRAVTAGGQMAPRRVR
jgi:hypothetical protein